MQGKLSFSFYLFIYLFFWSDITFKALLTIQQVNFFFFNGAAAQCGAVVWGSCFNADVTSLFFCISSVVDFDGSTKQNIDGKNINDGNDEPERGEPPAGEQLKEETLITDENFQGSMAVDEEKASNLGQVQVSKGPDEISGASFSVKRRGVKRKRDPDDDNYGDNEMESGHQVQGSNFSNSV